MWPTTTRNVQCPWNSPRFRIDSFHNAPLIDTGNAYNAQMAIVPAYVEARIRQRPLARVRVLPGSTPVVAFGDVRKATVATLGLNPSKYAFLDHRGDEREGGERRLETLKSLGKAMRGLQPLLAESQ
jgi:hypothetical protein